MLSPHCDCMDRSNNTILWCSLTPDLHIFFPMIKWDQFWWTNNLWWHWSHYKWLVVKLKLLLAVIGCLQPCPVAVFSGSHVLLLPLFDLLVGMDGLQRYSPLRVDCSNKWKIIHFVHPFVYKVFTLLFPHEQWWSCGYSRLLLAELFPWHQGARNQHPNTSTLIR